MEEILDVFLDRTENRVLDMLRKSTDSTSLLRAKMYYAACLSLAEEIKSTINEAAIKDKTLKELQQELKGDK